MAAPDTQSSRTVNPPMQPESLSARRLDQFQKAKQDN
jgi:hypothetical protein